MNLTAPIWYLFSQTTELHILQTDFVNCRKKKNGQVAALMTNLNDAHSHI